jgi:GNAT superfamily N-acetyltransferase
MKMFDVIQLERSQVIKASKIAATAFADDPVFTYLTPTDRESHIRALTWLMHKVIEHCTKFDRVYTTTDTQGVAAWLPPHQSAIGLGQFIQMAIQLQLYTFPVQCGWSRLGRWLAFLLAMEKAHQQDLGDLPHWYLAIAVVNPEFQGQGIGRSLLQPVLNQASQEGLPCYLVTFTERAVHFYQQNGFEIVGNQKFSPHSPPFWRLKRNPYIAKREQRLDK